MEQPIDPKRLEQLMKLMAAEEAAASMSQADGRVIYQSEPEVPGVYIDQYQMQQDAYNQAQLMNQSQEAFDTQENRMYAPPRAHAFDVSVEEMAAGNPNYQVSTEGQNVTVNAAGHIVRY